MRTWMKKKYESENMWRNINPVEYQTIISKGMFINKQNDLPNLMNSIDFWQF